MTYGRNYSIHIADMSFEVASVVKRGKKEFCREEYQLERENYQFRSSQA